MDSDKLFEYISFSFVSIEDLKKLYPNDWEKRMFRSNKLYSICNYLKVKYEKTSSK